MVGAHSSIYFQVALQTRGDFTVMIQEGKQSPAPHATLTPPLDSWFDASDDAPLIEELRGVAARLGKLGELIATGALARHERSSEPGASFLARLRQGVLPQEDAQRAWARSLDPPQLDLLERYAIAATGLLRDDLVELELDQIITPALWRNTCSLRDDIESLRALLATHDRLDALDQLLTNADALAIELLGTHEALGELFIEPNVRLERASIQYVDAWWVESIDF